MDSSRLFKELLKFIISISKRTNALLEYWYFKFSVFQILFRNEVPISSRQRISYNFLTS